MRLSAVAAIFAATVLVAGAAAGYLAGRTRADETTQAPPPTEPAVDDLLRQSGDTAGVWEKVDKNRAHHLQSGLVCDPAFFSLHMDGPKDKPVMLIPLQSVAIVASDRPRGDDVACNYGGSNGPLVVIEAIRLKPREDADDILNETRKAVASKYEGFYRVDLPVRMSIVEQGELGKGARYQHYEAKFEGEKYLATIWAGPVRGWAVVIYAVGISDNIFLQHAAVNTQWNSAARWVLATSISRGEPAP